MSLRLVWSYRWGFYKVCNTFQKTRPIQTRRLRATGRRYGERYETDFLLVGHNMCYFGDWVGESTGEWAPSKDFAIILRKNEMFKIQMTTC